MLKKIPKILSSDLIKVLMDMGHGNEICIANANFPAFDLGKRTIHSGAESIPLLLENVLDFFPLDQAEENPAILMQPLDQNEDLPEIWDDYKKIILSSKESYSFKDFRLLERFKFYERTKACYAIVLTSEQTIYSNIILRKGVIL